MGSGSTPSLRDSLILPTGQRGFYKKLRMIRKLGLTLWAISPWDALGLPNDVGSAYAFLASDLASFATGANIVFDGGFTLRPLVLVSPDEVRKMNL